MQHRQRWLIIWRHDDSTTQASLIDDGFPHQLPFNVKPEMIGPECSSIIAAVFCADPPAVPYVLIDGDVAKLWDGAGHVIVDSDGNDTGYRGDPATGEVFTIGDDDHVTEAENERMSRDDG